MAKRNLKLDTLIDASQLREQLTALTVNNDGDGSSQQIRADVLSLLKEASNAGRMAARDQLFSDGDGTACARRISHVQDEIIRVIYDFAIAHVYRASNASEAEKISITAVGGYGRGTLAPGSDIDLLFLLPYKQTAWGEQVVEYMLYMLWDMGFKVGHATRNIDECIRLSKQDMTIRTSILEVRYLHGDRELFETLTERFSKQVVARNASEFITAKLAERDARHLKSGASRYLVEPNVKDGKGGLRDLHTLFWIGKYFYNLGKSHALVGAGMLTEKEYRRFRKAEKFLWTVRCHMHFLTGRAEERLSFDIQREIADSLNYIDHPGLSAVERFMKHYFLVAKEVGDLTLIACAKLEEQQRKKVFGFNRIFQSVMGSTRKLKGTKDFVIENGRISTANDDVFRKDPVNLIRLFDLAEETGRDFHPDALELMARSLSLIGPEMRKDRTANKLFLKLLSSSKNSERMLRRMNETGFLGKFIPAFGKVVAMMQFNMYHHYTVDEHLIRSIGVLAAIENGGLADEHPLAHELVSGMEDMTILYVALLMHDIAKGRKEDHSIAGERVARQVCPRLGLDKQETGRVAWLVREHLTMSSIAQSRDLSDRKTIEDFAEVVQEVDRMRDLVVLTVCDIRAVGPGVWNGWKGQLLRTLYYETELMLNGGFSKIPLNARVANAKGELSDALSNWGRAERDKYLELPYPAYFLSTDLETQVRHMNFLRETDLTSEKLATTIHTRQFESITEITVVAPDYPRLLSIIAGACAAAGGDIEDAKIHTTSDGRALDSIFIRREYDNDEDEIRRAERIGKMIEEVLSGKTSLPKMIERDNRPMRRQRAFSITPTITINNDLSDTFSVIEIECLDRPGLLSDLTGAIADLNLDIGSAHVVTFGEKANDSFYVRDLVGHKITNGNRIRKIIHVLTQVMVPKASKEAA